MIFSSLFLAELFFQDPFDLWQFWKLGKQYYHEVYSKFPWFSYSSLKFSSFLNGEGRGIIDPTSQDNLYKNIKFNSNETMSFMVFIMDSLRGDEKIFNEENFPNYFEAEKKYGKNIKRFPQHYAEASQSLSSLYNIMYSLHPYHEYFLNYNLPAGIAPYDLKPFFPSVLKNNGYFMGFVGTSSWRSLPRSGWLNQNKLWDVNIETLSVAKLGHKLRPVTSRDQESVDTAMKLLRSRPEQPKFIVTMLHSSHYPSFWTREEEKEFVPQPGSDDHMNDYLKSVRFSDKLLFSRIMNDVQIRNQIEAKKLMVVFAADHGRFIPNEFGKTDFGHGSQKHCIWSSCYHIPLIFYGPEAIIRKFNEIPQQMTTNKDIIPTLIDLVSPGLDDSTYSLVSNGYSLLRTKTSPRLAVMMNLESIMEKSSSTIVLTEGENFFMYRLLECDDPSQCKFCFTLLKVVSNINVVRKIDADVVANSIRLFARYYDTYDYFLNVSLNKDSCYQEVDDHAKRVQ